MLIESGILWENMLVVIYITVSFRQFPKTLNQFFTDLVETKIWKLGCRFDLSNSKS